MSVHVVSGTVVAGSWHPDFGIVALADPNGASTFVFDTMSDEERDRRAVEYMERQRRELEGRNAWLRECDASFPVAGMSGDSDGKGQMTVWRTTGDYDRSLDEAVRFARATCRFCDTTTICQYIDDDCRSLVVCRTCLNKMFDAFDAYQAVTNE